MRGVRRRGWREVEGRGDRDVCMGCGEEGAHEQRHARAGGVDGRIGRRDVAACTRVTAAGDQQGDSPGSAGR